MTSSIVVTGGAGFIGSNLAHRLHRDGYDVTVIDDLSTGHIRNIADLLDEERFRFVRGSINDPRLLSSVFQGADYILHQAAIPSVPRSIKDPLTTNHANIDGTLCVLDAARMAEVKAVVYASSSSIYGDTPILPKAEDMVPQPQSPYAVTKRAGELYCQVYWREFGLRTVSLRYFNVYGPRQDPHSQYAAVIPRFMSRLMNDIDPEVYGDGTQSRDFTYVDDVVDANIQAMLSSAQGVFNISGGAQVTLLELLEEMGRLLGKRPRPRFMPRRPGDVLHSLADISRAREAFGYSPKVDLETGLRRTIEWFESPSQVVISR